MLGESGAGILSGSGAGMLIKCVPWQCRGSGLNDSGVGIGDRRGLRGACGG